MNIMESADNIHTYTQRQAEKETQTDRQPDRQTDNVSETETDRQTDGQQRSHATKAHSQECLQQNQSYANAT